MKQKMQSAKRFPVVLLVLVLVVSLISSCTTAAPTPEKTEEVQATEAVTTEEVQATEVVTTEEAQATEEPTTAAPSEEKTVIRMGMVSPPKSLNPLVSEYSFDHEVNAYVHCKLGQFQPDGTVGPYLATWDLSPDGMKYTFHINEKATWHDGQPVTAKDVAFTIKLVSDAKAGAIYFDRIKDIKGAQAFRDGKADDIEGVKVVDDKTLEVTLEGPSPGFLLTSQSFMFIMPEHLLGQYDSTEVMDAPFWRNPVGCGPYKWGEYKTDEYVRYEKYPDFFLGEPKIDEIYYRIGTWETLQAAFEVGELDLVQVEWTEAARFEKMDNVTLFRGPQYVDNVDLHTQHPWLDNIKFRKALLYALDRDAMVEAAFMGGASVPQNSFVTPWTLSPNITTYSYDPEKSKELLNEIGWDGKTTFKYLLSTGLPHYEKMTLMMQQYWADVGINIEIEEMEGATTIEKMIAGEYDMCLVGYGTMSLIPYAALNYFGADSLPPDGANWGFYVDREMTDLFNEAAREPDPERSKEIFYKITEMMTDRLPKLPIAVEEYIVAVNNERINIPNPVIVPRNRPGEQTWLTWNIYEWEVKGQ